MKKMFDRNNFVLAGLDGKQKKHSLIATLAVVLFFIASACTFMNFLYCLSECIGSIVCASADVAIKDALRSLPIFLSFFLTLSGLMAAHAFYRNESAEILKKRACKHAVIGIAFGAVIVIYVIVMCITGRYLSLTEGAPSPLYPLDALLYALAYIAGGVLLLGYFRKKAETNPFLGASRAPLWKKGRIVRCFFKTFWLIIALYGFCGFFYSLFIVDLKHGYLPFSLAIMFVSLVALLQFAVWELFYNNLTADAKKKFTLPLALISLAVSLLAAVLYFVALKKNLDGPSNVGFGILPIAFAASVNFATLLVVATPLIVSVAALVKGLFRRKR